MSQQTNGLYKFGSFRLDAQERLLQRDGVTLALTPKAFDLLLALLERHGRLVEKEELFQVVWPDTIVEESNLSSNIALIRKALSDGENGLRFIETVPKRGYRFVAEVQRVTDETPPGGQDIAPTVAGRLAPNLTVKDTRTTILATALWWRRHSWQRLSMALAIAALVIVAAVFSWSRVVDLLSPPPFQKIKVNALVRTGQPLKAVISPDGQYVAYVLKEGDQQSLWVKQVATSSTIQVVPPSKLSFSDSSFSRDGHYLFYSHSDGGFYRVPTLGGPAMKVADRINGAWSFSPDQQRIAVVRTDQAQKESTLVIVNADGTGERNLAVCRSPANFWGRPAWSPDGQEIAVVEGYGGEPGKDRIRAVRLSDGTEREIRRPPRWNRIRELAWLPDGQGFLLLGWQNQGEAVRLWHLSATSGEVRPISDDTTSYQGLSLAADGKSLVTIRSDWNKGIWSAPNGDLSQARQLMAGASDFDAPEWTPDGRIVFVGNSESGAGGTTSRNVFVMDADGSHLRQLTSRSIGGGIAVSPDGRYLVYGAGFKRKRPSDYPRNHTLWRINMDGSNDVLLLNDLAGWRPSFSRDGRWVVYTSDYSTLWRVSIDGGEPQQLTQRPTEALSADVSPDGKWIAGIYRANESAPWKLAILPFDGDAPVKTFALPASVPFTDAYVCRWTSDSQAITYKNVINGLMTLWRQPLDGGPATQIIDFKAERIQGFKWASDGRLAFVRTDLNTYVMLITAVR